MNLPLAQLSDVQEAPAREADLFDKVFWISIEMRELSARMSKGCTKLEVARAGKSFSNLRAAYTELETIRDQTSQMLEGLRHAIDKQERTDARSDH